MTVYDILNRLDGVRDRGRGRWMATCPAHEDRSPSLSVMLTDSGTILMHCFGSCSTYDVLAAIGLEMADLFPDRPEPRKGAGSSLHRLFAREQMEIIKHEGIVVAVAAASLLDGTAFEDDVIRVTEAVERIYRVAGESYGS